MHSVRPTWGVVPTLNGATFLLKPPGVSLDVWPTKRANHFPDDGKMVNNERLSREEHKNRMRMTEVEYQNLMKKRKKGGSATPKPPSLKRSKIKQKSASKFGAEKTKVDGITFDSKGEAKRYQGLKFMERSGAITELELQPKFVFEINGKPVLIKSKGYPNGRKASYIADFRYKKDGVVVVEDFKGMDTPISKLKRALVESMFGVTVEIVK